MNIKIHSVIFIVHLKSVIEDLYKQSTVISAFSKKTVQQLIDYLLQQK